MGRSLSADRRTKAKAKVTSGQGDRGTARCSTFFSSRFGMVWGGHAQYRALGAQLLHFITHWATFRGVIFVNTSFGHRSAEAGPLIGLRMIPWLRSVDFIERNQP